MARFVQTVNGAVVGRYDLLPDSWDGKNLRSLTKEQLKDLGWYHVVVEEPLGWDGNTHKITGPDFTIRADDVLEKYTLVPLTSEELAERQAAQAQVVQDTTTLNIASEQLQNQEIAELVNKLKALTGQN